MLMDAKRDSNPNVSTKLVFAVALLLGGFLVVSSGFAPAVAAFYTKHPGQSATTHEPVAVAAEPEPVVAPAPAVPERAPSPPQEIEGVREAERRALAAEAQAIAEGAERQRLELQQQLERNQHELAQSVRARQLEIERELEKARESLMAQSQQGETIDVERALQATELEMGQRLRALEQDHALQQQRFEAEAALRQQHLEQSMAQQSELLHRRMALAATPSRPPLASLEPAIPQDELLSLMASIAETDDDEEVRRAALRQLASARGEPAGRALAELYDGLSELDTKAELIHLLAGNRSAPAVDKLKEIAQHEADAELRLQAVEVLGALGRGGAVLAPAGPVAPVLPR